MSDSLYHERERAMRLVLLMLNEKMVARNNLNLAKLRVNRGRNHSDAAR